MEEEHLIGAPIEAQEATGLDEAIQAEVLGQDPDDAAVDEEHVTPGLKTVDKSDDSISELVVGLAAWNLEPSEAMEDLTVDGVRLPIRAALERTEVALAQANIDAGFAPSEACTLNRTIQVRRPHADKFLPVDDRAQGLCL